MTVQQRPVMVTKISTKPNSFGYYGVIFEDELEDEFIGLWNYGRGEPKPTLKQIYVLVSACDHMSIARAPSTFEYVSKLEGGE